MLIAERRQPCGGDPGMTSVPKKGANEQNAHATRNHVRYPLTPIIRAIINTGRQACRISQYPSYSAAMKTNTLLFGVASLAATSAYGWGAKGHQAVG